MRRICFVCESKYQLLNCLGLIRYQNKFKNNEIDLFIKSSIIDNKTGLLSISKKYGRIKIFWIEDIAASLNNSIYHKIQMVSNSSKFWQIYGLNKKEYHNIYFEIYVAIPTRFAAALIFNNKQASVYYYEDGLGSYGADLVTQVFKIRSKLMYSMFGNFIHRLYPKGIYLNEPKLYNGNMTNDVYENKAISMSDKDFVDDMKNIFKARTLGKNSCCRWIYITQPIKEMCQYVDFVRKIESEIIEITNAINHQGVVRVHPMDSYNEEAYNIEKAFSMWELDYIDKANSDNIVLISWFSNAQFTPKTIYNKEPYLVFTYKLVSHCFLDKRANKYCDVMVKKLLGNYDNHNRIFVPTTMMEYKNVLSYILSEKK